MNNVESIFTNAQPISYAEYVRKSTLQRFRVVIFIAIPVFLLFNLLDWAVYPQEAWLFLNIRIAVAVILFASWLNSYRDRGRQWSLNWIFIVCVPTLSVSLMEYLADGSHSRYYHGLDVMFLGMLTINPYSIRHNFYTGLAVLVSHFLAIGLHTGEPHWPGIVSSFFFLSSTLMFILTLTHLYARQHRSEYDATLRLREQAAALDQANQKMRQSERLKDRFFANVSHELRTPLSLILGPAQQCLEEVGLPENVRQNLLLIKRNASSLLSHVNDLLDLSRLDAEKMTFQPRSVDVVRVIRFVASHFENTQQAKGLTLDLFAPESCWVEIDRHKFERILFNLLGNATKFTPRSGRILLWLNVKEDGADSERVKLNLVVEDSGPGIPADKRQIIFDRFQQVEDDDTRTHGGTGLGLAIVKEFVGLHAGEISVGESALGGARFEIEMSPLRGQPTDEQFDEESTCGDILELCREVYGEAERSKISSGVHPSLDDVTRPKVLVVEDNAEMNRFLCDALQVHYQVFTSFNGGEGYVLAERIQPDLIITDMMMPRMSGQAMVDKIRASELLAQIPIIVLSAKADEALRHAMLQGSVQDWLIKPFSITELRARASNLITMKLVRDLLERELRTKNSDVVKMARDLAENKQQLAQALSAAESASRLKDEFLMNLSHELRTPMTAIVGWSNLLVDDGLAIPEAEQAVEAISRNARIQNQMLDDLLDLAESLQGLSQLNIEEVNVGNVVTGVTRAFSQEASHKGISLNVKASDSCVVRGDQQRLAKMVRHLLDNAIKFTPQNGAVWVSLSSISHGDTSTIAGFSLSIRDSGPGIDEQFLPHVFDNLRQGARYLTKAHRGLGSGLAITKQIVDLHGGDITVRNNVDAGVGCTFEVRIPNLTV